MQQQPKKLEEYEMWDMLKHIEVFPEWEPYYSQL